MLKKVYYFTLRELDDLYGLPAVRNPFDSSSLKDFLDDILGATGYPKLKTSVSDTNVETLWQEMLARYNTHYIVKFVTSMEDNNDYSYSNTTISKLFKKWIWRFLSLLDQTSPYYLALLTAYTSAATHLMDDIKSTSENKVKYNDTPQNANTGGTYEGDDYLTNFTKTEGETSSPLMSKIMRLKEIQDHYKNVMADWVKEFERLYFESENEDE